MSRVHTIVLLAAAAFALAGCAPARQSVKETPRSVTVVAAQRQTVAISQEYAARIKAHEEIVVSPKISGRVASTRAEVGQRVGKGQVLFTLEAKDYEAQYRQAKAALESARANLTRTSDSSLSSQILQAQAAVHQAQVQYDEAKDFADRTRKMFDNGTVSRQQLDSAQARFKSAEIALGTARDNLSLIQEKGGPQSTGVASTQVEQAQATLDLAQSQLDNTVITSPIAGLVAARNVDDGELVATGAPAFVVIDSSTVTAEASVSQDMVQQISRGETVAVSVDTGAGPERMQGEVSTISPAADPRSLGYLIKVAVNNPNGALRPGMFARVAFPVENRTHVLVVPNTAVVTDSGVDYVYVVVEGAVKRKSVET
ncbi:MAG TPA: efflux RND transporter periplasmic adaptor subunit, partial [Spirochaetia bacterium]|nr:efflux RND transporter periplasmic adaptor subunit [Spirochaetia bacterium]